MFTGMGEEEGTKERNEPARKTSQEPSSDKIRALGGRALEAPTHNYNVHLLRVHKKKKCSFHRYGVL